MLINPEHTRHLNREKLAVLKVVHVIIVARDGAVGLIKVETQAFARDAMSVLAVDLLLEGLGGALIGLDAIDTLAEISPTTTAVKRKRSIL